MRIQPIMLGGAKLPRVRGEGRRTKVRGQMAESGGEILGRGQQAPSPPTRGLGDRYKLRQRGPGLKCFLTF